MWHGTTYQLDDFLPLINSVHPSIKFTMEIAGANINCLDKKISITSRRHQFGIFRKPTHTDIPIHGSSFSHPSHKYAAYSSAINRLVSIPLEPIALTAELNLIKYIANMDHIKFNVDNLVRRKLIRRALDSTASLPRDVEKKPKWLRIPYLGKFSASLGRIFKSSNFRPTYYSLSTVGKLFCRLTDPISQCQRSGAYKIAEIFLQRISVRQDVG